VIMQEDENPPTNLMQGIVKFHVYITPPSPAQEINFTLEYDISYLTEAFA
jgi:phage tail sheath protein FI